MYREMKSTKRIKAFLGAFAVAVLVSGCSGSAPKDPELEKAAQVIREMAAPMNLKSSMFSAGFPGGTPRQFVSYIFSDMGAAEWPIAGESGGDLDIQMDQLGSSGLSAEPTSGVGYEPLRPDPKGGKQIVVKFDDAKGLIILEGYVDPAGAPVMVVELKFRSVQPNEAAMIYYRSNAEMGMSDQAF